MYGLNYDGLRKKETYDEIVDYLENKQEKIKYPDRTAKQLRNSPQLSNLLDGDGEGYDEMDKVEKRRVEEVQKVHIINQIASDTNQTARVMTVRETQTENKVMRDTGSEAYKPNMRDTGSEAYKPNMQDTGSEAYKPDIRDTGSEAYKPDIVNSGSQTENQPVFVDMSSGDYDDNFEMQVEDAMAEQGNQNTQRITQMVATNLGEIPEHTIPYLQPQPQPQPQPQTQPQTMEVNTQQKRTKETNENKPKAKAKPSKKTPQPQPLPPQQGTEETMGVNPQQKRAKETIENKPKAKAKPSKKPAQKRQEEMPNIRPKAKARTKRGDEIVFTQAGSGEAPTNENKPKPKQYEETGGESGPKRRGRKPAPQPAPQPAEANETPASSSTDPIPKAKPKPKPKAKPEEVKKTINKPKFGTEKDTNTSRSYWKTKNIGYLIDQLSLHGVRLSKEELKGRNRIKKPELLEMLIEKLGI